MNLEQAIFELKRLLKEAMATERKAIWIWSHRIELAAIADVFWAFSAKLFTDDTRVGVSPAESIAAGNLLAMLAEVNDEIAPAPQVGMLVWAAIAWKIYQLLARMQQDD